MVMLMVLFVGKTNISKQQIIILLINKFLFYPNPNNLRMFNVWLLIMNQFK